jgi:hypothetical protein
MVWWVGVPAAARYGLVWSIVLALGLGMLANGWSAAQLRPNSPTELWGIGPGPGQAEQLLVTLGDISEWTQGDRQRVDVVVAFEAPSLWWALRDYTQVRFVTQVEPSDLASVIITAQTQNIDGQTGGLAMTANYRGQDFIWRRYPGWYEALPPDFWRWLAFRSAPLVDEQVILWLRGDLVLGSSLPAAP